MAHSINTESTPTQLEAQQLEAQLAALRTGAGMAMLPGGWIAVTGGDRVRWLNGMVTNSVQALTPGDGAYSFLLSAQGRIQGDCIVWAPDGAQTDRLILQTSAAQVEPITTLLDRFIIMDDVELAPLSLHGLLIAGPTAAEALTAIGIPARASRLLKHRTIDWQDRSLTLVNAYSPLVPRFELWSANPEDLDAIREALNATPVGQAAVELLRIAEGTPSFGTDIRDRDLPQETAQTRALHFNKGCYLGQEIVERIRSRGNVHRTFTTFVLTGETPTAPTPIQALQDGGTKPVGELTSVASAPIDGQILALGFIRREALERGLPLSYAGGAAAPLTPSAPEPPVPVAAAS
jgi:aminomethyltransferase